MPQAIMHSPGSPELLSRKCCVAGSYVHSCHNRQIQEISELRMKSAKRSYTEYSKQRPKAPQQHIWPETFN